MHRKARDDDENAVDRDGVGAGLGDDDRNGEALCEADVDAVVLGLGIDEGTEGRTLESAFEIAREGCDEDVDGRAVTKKRDPVGTIFVVEVGRAKSRHGAGRGEGGKRTETWRSAPTSRMRQGAWPKRSTASFAAS